MCQQQLKIDPGFPIKYQKIRVHAFYCVLALTLAGLLEKELSQKVSGISIQDALESLNNIKEIHLLYPMFKKQNEKELQTEIILSEIDNKQYEELKHITRLLKAPYDEVIRAKIIVISYEHPD